MASDEAYATKADLEEVETSVAEILAPCAGTLTVSAATCVLRGEVGALRDDVHILGVRFERLESKVDAVIEGLAGFQTHITREMRELEERLSARIKTLEEVVREHSQEIRKNAEETRKSSEDIRALTIAVADLRDRFDRRDDYVALDKRVTALEERLRTR